MRKRWLRDSGSRVAHGQLPGASNQPMIQLTRSGIRGSCDLEALREEFASAHTVRLPQLISADLMTRVLERMEGRNWVENGQQDISRELLLDDQRATQILLFLANTPDFLALIRRITSCEMATNFVGRIYRMLPSPDYHIDWHTDISEGENRLVGMSVNLSPRQYSGGLFQLGQPGSDEILRELPNVRLADAILFRVSPALMHRVTPVNGNEPKTAFAGWFRSSGGDFVTTVRQHTSS